MQDIYYLVRSFSTSARFNNVEPGMKICVGVRAMQYRAPTNYSVDMMADASQYVQVARIPEDERYYDLTIELSPNGKSIMSAAELVRRVNNELSKHHFLYSNLFLMNPSADFDRAFFDLFEYIKIQFNDDTGKM